MKHYWRNNISHALLIILVMQFPIACHEHAQTITKGAPDSIKVPDSMTSVSTKDTLHGPLLSLDPGSTEVDPDSVVAYSKTLIGVPYLYASTDPAKGFDCSGFITYVFNHFNIKVPRSSVDFTNYGRDVTPEEAKPGDLILFTGTDSTIRIVGHMGLIETAGKDSLRFIHSSSGKANGVVITKMGDYYRKRFVKVIRIFPETSFR
jgi:hypothetical protein